MKHNYKDKIKRILERNDGLITRKEMDEKNIPSVFLYRFINDNKLLKVGPGVFVSLDYPYDELFIFQKIYPEIIYSGLTALSLNEMTDKMSENIEITVMHGKNHIRNKTNLITHTIRNKDLLELGVTYKATRFGNLVKTYGPERLFCNLIKERARIEPEVFIKGIRLFLNLKTDRNLLFSIAEKLHIKVEVVRILEVIDEDRQEFFAGEDQ